MSREAGGLLPVVARKLPVHLGRPRGFLGVCVALLVEYKTSFVHHIVFMCQGQLEHGWDPCVRQH